MEGSHSGQKDRPSSMFQLGRKRPDLIQSHDHDQNRQSDLQEQVKNLTSELDALDSHLSSQSMITPRDFADSLRLSSEKGYERGLSTTESFDGSMFNYSMSNNSSAVNGGDSNLHVDHVEGFSNTLDKSKERENKHKHKEKDVNRSNSFKSTVQRFAHRTFAKANWRKAKKSVTVNLKGVNNLQEGDGDSIDSGNGLKFSEKPPDVIDITANDSLLSKSRDNGSINQHILAPPDSFRTDQTAVAGEVEMRKPKTTKVPKGRVISKMTPTHSFSTWEKFNARLKSSTSSPSLSIDAINQQAAARRRCATPHLDSNGLESSVETSTSQNSYSTDLLKHTLNELENTNSRYRHHLSSNNNGNNKSNHHHHIFSTLTKTENRSETFTHGFLSARKERNVPGSQQNIRHSWTGRLTSPRRQVNPNALAEIQVRK